MTRRVVASGRIRELILDMETTEGEWVKVKVDLTDDAEYEFVDEKTIEVRGIRFGD